MKNIINLTPKTIIELENIIKYNDKFRARKRAETILLSYKGKTVNEIVELLDLKHQAIWKWFRNFKKMVYKVYMKSLVVVENLHLEI